MQFMVFALSKYNGEKMEWGARDLQEALHFEKRMVDQGHMFIEMEPLISEGDLYAWNTGRYRSTWGFHSPGYSVRFWKRGRLIEVEQIWFDETGGKTGASKSFILCRKG